MRKILTKSQQKSKERFNQILVGLVLIFIMILSVLGYGLVGRDSSKEEKIIFNGIEFKKINNLWEIEQENFKFVFKYNPKEIERVNSQVDYFDSYYNKPLYISSENLEATEEIYQNMYSFVERMQKACLNEEECEGDLPIKNCENNFIIIRESNNSRITQNQNCVFIEGNQENLVKLTDDFLFKILGI